MTTQKQVKWRRERVFDLSSKGLLQVQISKLLNIPEYIISRDIKYLRLQSQQNIQHYLDHQLPLEFDKALHSLNYILANAFATAEKSEGTRDKLAALSLAKDTLGMKLDILSSTQAVERAVSFVTSHKEQHRTLAPAHENMKIRENMNLHRLDKILDKYNNNDDDINNTKPPLSPEEQQREQEIAEAQALMQHLYKLHSEAYQKRKDKWFKEHPGQQTFAPTLKEERRDIQKEEWVYYFASRLCRTPEERYQDERHPTYGWNHKSDVHSIEDRECKPGCRFWPEIGRIEALEILEDYMNYNGYDEVRKMWESLPEH